jgi:hypothetical protein
VSDQVKVAFEQSIRLIALDRILPTRRLPPKASEKIKYKRIIASVGELGLIEPLSVSPQQDGTYLLLDGHVRLEALRLHGISEARCVLAHDDEAYTYNKRINRLATVQEHYMIVRAFERGVSEEKLARALNVDIPLIRRRRNLLAGITDDVVELLNDKPVGHGAFAKLRKMKPIRQLEAAELMVSANNYTNSYARALLLGSAPDELHHPEQLQRSTGLSTEQMARLQREMDAVSQDYKELEASYGDDMLVLVVAAGFLERMISKPEIERFLAARYPEFLENFRAIAQASSLDQAAAA